MNDCMMTSHTMRLQGVMRENPRLIAENNELHAMLIAESDRSDVTTGTTALKRL